MNFSGFKNFVLAVSLLAGVIVGAGIFVLPYVFNQVGFGAGLFYLAAFTLVFAVIHLMYAEIIMKTPGREHRFAGYAKYYLGDLGYYLAILTTIIGMFFVLAIYLVLAAEFLPLIGLPGGWLGILLFWALSSWPIFLNIRDFVILEFLSNLAIFAIIYIMLIIALPQSFQPMLFKPIKGELFFLPFGAIFFSLAGRSAVPEMIEYFRKAKNFSLSQAIIWGTVVSALVYVVFIYAVLALSNGAVSEDAISGLKKISPFIFTLLTAIALMNLWNSYPVIGIDVKESLQLDLGMKRWLACALILLVPPLIYFLGFQKFFPLVNLSGGLFLGLEGIFIVLMWKKLTRQPTWEWLAWILIAVFSIAIGYQIYEIFV